MKLLQSERPLIMGILNITPDSFSDGGKFIEPDIAVEHAVNMVGEGADIIDIGGESTRPGSERVPAREQIERVIPILTAIKKAIPAGISISIDTTLSEVADAALDAGASIINDVTAGRDDDGILELAAERRVPIILMHMQGTPNTMQKDPHYNNVVEEIRGFLLERAQVAEGVGVLKENIIIDPGIGFGKTKEHNLALVANLKRFTDTGYPVLLGASRKRFMGSICHVAQFSELVGATCATTVIGAQAGVKIFRVHDVKANRQALDVALAIEDAPAIQ